MKVFIEAEEHREIENGHTLPFKSLIDTETIVKYSFYDNVGKNGDELIIAATCADGNEYQITARQYRLLSEKEHHTYLYNDDIHDSQEWADLYYRKAIYGEGEVLDNNPPYTNEDY